MALWYKQGVMGKLIPEAANGLRLTEKLYAQYNEELYITSIQEGTHSPGSFHSMGRAWDQRMGRISKELHQKFLGNSFQVVDEGNHRHVEYDPR